eukprot:TRINITY_DN2603_c0_g1_i1.p1 TRINITY_DN2603_c0_g1~~TRINITY_DN2603_c0_g1_i1.p1  ORF type:complete len:523 (+),score=94.28 TRINITY_DN2603_c0_g1_i1:1870-3438(+)
MSVVHTTCGSVQGKAAKGVESYLGIPYAAAPVGELRLRPPQPIKWEGVKICDKAGKTPVQTDLAGLVPGDPVGEAKDPETGLPKRMSEDCLFLNIFKPEGSSDKLPVMVWIHGGGFETGASTLPLYIGTNLAKSQNVMVITLNYRLSSLGFLYLKDEVRSGKMTENLGIRDQIFALEWIKQNVSLFGGDSTNITLFGESAGAMSVATIMTSKLSAGKDLFQKAICQSGAASSSNSEAEAETVAQRYAKALGIERSELTLDYLMKLPISKIAAADKNMKRCLQIMLPFAPVWGTPDFPHPLEAIKNGAGKDVILMSGYTRDEYSLFMFPLKGNFTSSRVASFATKKLTSADKTITQTEAESIASDVVHSIAQECEGPVNSRQIYSQVGTDLTFLIPHHRMLDAHGGRSYSYQFAWSSPMKKFGSCHALEIPFVFGTHKHNLLKLWAGSGKQANLLSENMMDAWGAFARTGNPSTTATGNWPVHDALSRPMMVFGDKQSAAPVLMKGAPPHLKSYGGLLTKAKL